jgi:hypothetical protein
LRAPRKRNCKKNCDGDNAVVLFSFFWLPLGFWPADESVDVTLLLEGAVAGAGAAAAA